MRAAAIVSVSVFVLAAFVLRTTGAVTCTADVTVEGCIDCTHTSNIVNPECVAEAATTTPSPNYYFTTAQPPSAQWGQYRFPWHKVRNVLLMF